MLQQLYYTKIMTVFVNVVATLLDFEELYAIYVAVVGTELNHSFGF
jgi:hypothetical protein